MTIFVTLLVTLQLPPLLLLLWLLLLLLLVIVVVIIAAVVVGVAFGTVAFGTVVEVSCQLWWSPLYSTSSAICSTGAATT